MGILETIKDPLDVKRLEEGELTVLAAEIRDLLVSSVAKTGGHLGPNLGVVELTIALHRVFDSPRDPILFDTGHQAYVHKMLTGRAGQFGTLRQEGGLSGIPARPSPSTTSSRTRMPPPPCRTPTGWPRRSRCAGRPAARWWP